MVFYYRLNMKIGILTHPLKTNYGGILQCYALYSYLKHEGHTPIVIHREVNKSFFLWVWIRNILKAMHCPRYYTTQILPNKALYIDEFIQEHLVLTSPIRNQKDMIKVCRKYELGAVIVGSDQVWRADFASKYGYNYFLDFVPSYIKKLSYAASFGTSTWDYSEKQTRKIKKLLESFEGISVREEDGIKLCEENLGIIPTLHIDPTLLLPENVYNNIASEQLVKEKYAFIYWLGEKKDVQKDINELKERDYKIVTINLREQVVLPSIEDWLSYIKYADIILTDSFHGCVFSIIFKKRFIVKTNHSGGNGRLRTLLKLLNIDDCQCQGNDIDYNTLSHRLINLQNYSFKYFQSLLSGENLL